MSDNASFETLKTSVDFSTRPNILTSPTKPTTRIATPAAVIIAQIFVAAPFYIRGARAGLAAVDRRLEHIAATLGSSNWRIFWRVTLPLAGRSLISGAIMTWGRALGEFGATIMFAGNFQGRTQTMPLAIYIGLQEDLGGALTLASILLAVSFVLLITVRLLTGRGVPDA